MSGTVAIVGRPNVGKSSLFNRLIGKPVAIVDPTAGVTRDRIHHRVRRDGFDFDLVDTGGIGITDHAKLETDVLRQVMRAIEHADLILFVTDGRDGVLPLDFEVATILRRHQDRVVVVVNKLDHEGMDAAVYEFAVLGLGEPVPFSAEQLRGLDGLLAVIRQRLPLPAPTAPEEEPRLKICLAGRRNVGKSSLTNALCGEERVIVADLPGTTRDAIDIPLDTAHGHFLLIDTAGLRKRRQLTQDLEFYAACRTERAIRRTDVVFLILDASDELGTVDKRLAQFCESEGKPTVIVINKWDLAEAGGATRTAYETWLRDRLPGMSYAPMLITCALTGQHLGSLLALARDLATEAAQRVPTAEINRLLELAVTRRRPRRTGGGQVKIYYGTQAEASPPTLVFFVNRTDWIEPGYHRFLENFFRQNTPFRRVPLRIIFKTRESRFREGLDREEHVSVPTKADASPTLVMPRRHRRRQGRRPERPA
jgi:GTP-binding protein